MSPTDCAAPVERFATAIAAATEKNDVTLSPARRIRVVAAGCRRRALVDGAAGGVARRRRTVGVSASGSIDRTRRGVPAAGADARPDRWVRSCQSLCSPFALAARSAPIWVERALSSCSRSRTVAFEAVAALAAAGATPLGVAADRRRTTETERAGVGAQGDDT